MEEETGGLTDFFAQAAILGLGLVAGTLPLWLGPALFCTSGEQYCGTYWLFWGALALLVAGGLGAVLGGGGPGLAVGVVGVAIGSVIAIGYQASTLTWSAIVWWAGIEGLLFGFGYMVGWVIGALVRGRRGAS